MVQLEIYRHFAGCLGSILPSSFMRQLQSNISNTQHRICNTTLKVADQQYLLFFHFKQYVDDWLPQKSYSQHHSHTAAKTLDQAFIARRLDYCNSLLYGVSHSLIRKVQSVQNAAAWLLTGTRCGDHISTVLHQLHWLPVQRRVDFKLACCESSNLGPARHLRTWLTTYTWSQKVLDVGCVRLPTNRVLFHALTTCLATEVLLPPGHTSETASQHT